MAAYLVLCAGVLLSLACELHAQAAGSTEEFDVKPGGLYYTYTRRLGDFSCSFSYAAQGGTNEKWHMSIGVDEESRYFSCSIWRPPGSYLFFISFKAEVSGGKIDFCEAYVSKKNIIIYYYQLKKVRFTCLSMNIYIRAEQ
ncbi:hypothetical protein GDO81_001125 [Engystomops pustulosus]|uniref:Myeloid-derived growth factor n=1 Tax=Engystomops pustulosus TaxID=76066 RepID=A0AAV7DBC1_ENGPU|nr:hypothetical protein GDO81_001125 [Engystomops pustulosus]